MITGYESVYREAGRDLGTPAKGGFAFFEACENRDDRLLDVGCGQGRDALHIVRTGYRVSAEDCAPKTPIDHFNTEIAEKHGAIRDKETPKPFVHRSAGRGKNEQCPLLRKLCALQSFSVASV